MMRAGLGLVVRLVLMVHEEIEYTTTYAENHSDTTLPSILATVPLKQPLPALVLDNRLSCHPLGTLDPRMVYTIYSCSRHGTCMRFGLAGGNAPAM